MKTEVLPSQDRIVLFFQILKHLMNDNTRRRRRLDLYFILAAFHVVARRMSSLRSLTALRLFPLSSINSNEKFDAGVLCSKNAWPWRKTRWASKLPFPLGSTSPVLRRVTDQEEFF